MERAGARDAVVVCRLRVEGEGLDPSSARASASRLIGAAELHPAGLGPSAILCVRRLRDPRPGQFSLVSGPLRPDEEWSRAVAESLAQLARRAARPACGAVAPGAEAVLFADRAEWLACLARDWLDGRLADRWWWRVLIDPTPGVRAVASAWLDTVESAPAALHRLAPMGRAIAFARALPDPAARALRGRLMQRFGLAGRRTPSPLTPTEAADRPGTVTVTAAVRWAPEALAAGLDGERSALLAVGLTLARSPAAARRPEFAAAIAQLLRTGGREVSNPAERPSGPSGGPSPEESPGGAPDRPRAWAIPAPRPDGARGTAAAEGTGKPREFAAGPVQGPRGVGEIVRPVAEGPAIEAQASPRSEAAGTPRREDGHEQPEGPSPRCLEPQSTHPAARPSVPFEDRPASFEPAALAWEARIETAYGGIFYLINLALYLGLYEDFSGGGSTLALPLADFLALVGERFLGAKLRADPAWDLLARLADRPSAAEPGGGFEPPGDWRIPPEWLRPFPARSDWTCEISKERLRVLHPAGFAVLDVPAGADVPAELAPYGPVDIRPAYGGPTIEGTPLSTWLDRLVPYLLARLRRALGVEDEALPSLTLEHRATVSLSAEHLDIVLSLEALPIAVRFAGLDRDPGWLPSLGRAVSFHFRCERGPA